MFKNKSREVLPCGTQLYLRQSKSVALYSQLQVKMSLINRELSDGDIGLLKILGINPSKDYNRVHSVEKIESKPYENLINDNLSEDDIAMLKTFGVDTNRCKK